MQNDIGNHKPVNPEKYKSHRAGTCEECQRLGRDLIEMIELKNKAEAERDFYFKLEADKQKHLQELHLKISKIDEILAQAKYTRLIPQYLVDLLNEIRKGL